MSLDKGLEAFSCYSYLMYSEYCTCNDRKGVMYQESSRSAVVQIVKE